MISVSTCSALILILPSLERSCQSHSYSVPKPFSDLGLYVASDSCVYPKLAVSAYSYSTDRRKADLVQAYKSRCRRRFADMPLHRPPSAKGILYLAFNQDNTCISIADDKGIKIYSLETHKVLYQSDLGAVRYAGFIVCSWVEYQQLS